MHADLGPELQPVYAEVRHNLPVEVLHAIADMCKRQHARFYEATYWMKVDLKMLPPPEDSGSE
jgi:hypothetical protein